jgi:hypothetical protein
VNFLQSNPSKTTTLEGGNAPEAAAVDSSCIVPTYNEIKDMASLSAMWNSHNWTLDKVERFGLDAILTSIHCRNCGLQKKSIHSNLEESASKSRRKG